jgi:hypothetical protein
MISLCECNIIFMLWSSDLEKMGTESSGIELKLEEQQKNRDRHDGYEERVDNDDERADHIA